MKQATLILLVLMQLSLASAEQQKIDVLGLFAGMPSTAVSSLIRTSGWRCKNLNDPVLGKAADPLTGDFSFTCDTPSGQLNFMLAGSLSGTPLFWLRLFFVTAEKPTIVAQSISQQFGKNSQVVPDRSGNPIGYRWTLDNGSILEMSGSPETSGNYTLDLTSVTIQENNAKAKMAKDVARNPTPKF